MPEMKIGQKRWRDVRLKDVCRADVPLPGIRAAAKPMWPTKRSEEGRQLLIDAGIIEMARRLQPLGVPVPQAFACIDGPPLWPSGATSVFGWYAGLEGAGFAPGRGRALDRVRPVHFANVSDEGIER